MNFKVNEISLSNLQFVLLKSHYLSTKHVIYARKADIHAQVDDEL